MPQSPRTRRIQRAKRKGKSIQEIAAREGVSERTVHRAISGPRFQQQLAVQITTINTARLENVARSERIAGKLLAELDRRTDNPELIKKLKFTPKDIADLGKFSHLQHDQAVGYLKEEIRKGQEQMDKELAEAAKILDVTPEQEEARV